MPPGAPTPPSYLPGESPAERAAQAELEGLAQAPGAPQAPETSKLDPRQGNTPFAPENYAGIPGSPPVTDKGLSTRALRPRKLSHRLKYVAQLAAMGCTQKEICERTGYTQHRMSVVVNAPEVSNEIERTRRHIFERDPEVALKTMLPKALESIEAVLSHEAADFKEKRDKSSTAFSLLERTHGKPKQQMEMGGSLLLDLFNMMDAKMRDQGLPERRTPAEAQEAQEAEFRELQSGEAPPVPSALRDPYDTYIDQNLPAPRALQEPGK